jgi:hypothetical protein
MTYDVMNLCASWYPVLIVDDGPFPFSPSSLASAFGTSAGGDPRAGAGRCTDKEPAEAALFFLDRFFDFLGVVTAARKKRKQSSVLIIRFFATPGIGSDDSAAPSADTDTDTDLDLGLDLDSERACPGPPPGREELEEEEVDEDEVGEEIEDLDEEGE